MTLTGETIAHYRVLDLIGRGGMGDVYLADDLKLGRRVALKFLSERFQSDADARRRFLREARATAALDHPFICHVHDAGESDGYGYIALEYVEGETLGQRLRGGPLTGKHALQLATEMAEALEHAHRQRIVHRDLKPSNVMITADGHAKVMDFGLATMGGTVSPSAETATLAAESGGTAPGVTMGTLAYMSPEQLRGERLDARSDLFALGVVLFEMLTGVHPFQRPGNAETIGAILNQPARPLITYLPDASDLLEHVVHKALAKERDLRYQSAQDLRADVIALSARTDGGSASSRARAVVAASQQPHEAGDAPADSLAVLPFTNAGGADAEYLSDGIAESLINSFSQIARLRVIPRCVAFRYKGQEIDPRVVGRELGVRMLLSGKVVERGGHLSVQAELVEAAANKQLWGERWHRPLADIFEVEEAIARQIADKLRLRLSGEEKKQLARRYTENSEAYQLYLNARYHFLKRTPEGLKKGVQYCEQAIEKDAEFALAYAALADCYIVLGAMSVFPARQALAKAKAAATRAVEADGTLAEAHNSLAFARMACDWDWAEAEKGFRHALELNPASWITHDWYGQTLHCQGRLDEGLAHIRRAQELEPLSVVLHHHAAWILWLARRDDEAIEECRKAHELDPSFPLPYMWSGLAYEQKSMHEESIGALRKGCELWGGTLFAWDP